MSFEYYKYLYLLLFLPFLILFLVLSYRKRKKLLLNFASIEVLPKITRASFKKIYFFKSFLLLLALTSLITALAQPKFGYKFEEVQRKGIDIIVAVDVSASMLADDIKPNRLERSQRKLKDFLGILQGDRVGLVAFAGTSYLQCPLTYDYQAFNIFLDQLEPSFIPIPGTSITNALETAMNAFQKNVYREKAIILLTDGEEHENSLNVIIPYLQKEKIRVFTIGIGSEEGAAIPTETGELKKDENGNVVLTRLDSSSLQNLSEATGGLYVKSVSGDFDIKRIYFNGIKNVLEETELAVSQKRTLIDRFQIFIGIAFFLLLLEFLLSVRKHRIDIQVKSQ